MKQANEQKYSQQRKNNPPLPKRLIRSVKSSIKSSNFSKSDLYHELLILPWWQFLTFIIVIYTFTNVLFAFAYILTGDGIANAAPGSFRDSFFFSVQTMSTVGYGAMYPRTLQAQILVTVEVLTGLLLLSILTGLMFARFSIPTARVIFSNLAVICPFNGIPTLMFRAANARGNRILEGNIKAIVLRNEVSQEGHKFRRFYDLNLVRSQTPVFGLSWLVMHQIEPTSPLYGLTQENLLDSEAEIWVTLTGLDETFSQTIHARHNYSPLDLVWNMRFVDILAKNSQGEYEFNFTHFHEVESL